MSKAEERVAIVTGAGQGLGAEIASALAQAGLRVAVNDINPDRAERVAAAIRSAGGQAIGIQADVSNKFNCVTLIEATRAEWGRLDILVNNAAVRPSASLLKLDEWDWNRCIEVNLKGVFLMTQLCARVMVDENQARGGGVIINIGDGLTSNPLQAAYAASKAGILGLTQAAAQELAPHAIRVHTLLPEPEQAIAPMVLDLCQ
jgi:3-oxoacyl-[acyl-carrier protein] reductase